MYVQHTNFEGGGERSPLRKNLYIVHVHASLLESYTSNATILYWITVLHVCMEYAMISVQS